MDIATAKAPVPRVVNLKIFRGGRSRVDFVREIYAVTLFREGFGDLLGPAAGCAAPCTHWETVAEGRDYLAVAGFDLQRIIKENGNTSTTPLKLAPGIFWQKPAALFEACACKGKGKLLGVTLWKSCDRVQVLLPPKALTLIRSCEQKPFDLHAEGAVIFGKSEAFPWRWPGSGDPQQETAWLYETNLDL
ncbi:hypothetical protein B0H63DRAFT_517052 [Podospora didyma]|uniref:Uncharacterized protein n=1 Tax=Podospora didyma TaxID=330526 RepID=A0AAE0P5Y2_9PEZI|nr:hypothetical protein B0H63DRAFT_517052 [Podospora didyma]